MRIPPLLSGGIMLSYHCNSACRHCLYRCSPARPDDWMSLEMAERVFRALKKEPRLGSIHLAGGEATLRFDHLCDVVRLATKMDIPLIYLETNGGWCTDREETREKFTRLRAAGLPGILVSASMYHNEFIPFSRTRTAVEVGRKVFGDHGVMVWTSEIYRMLERLPNPDKTRPLKEFCRETGIEDWFRLPQMYHLTPGGRTPDALRRCYTPRPAESFDGANCAGTLLSTSHFHIDPYGNLFTGLCPGISAGCVDDFHPDIQPDTYPLLHLLMEEGSCGLAQMARDRHGFAFREDGYVSKCDLCYDVRRHLHRSNGFAELRPADFYGA